jgi:hypothetical protein
MDAALSTNPNPSDPASRQEVRLLQPGSKVLIWGTHLNAQDADWNLGQLRQFLERVPSATKALLWIESSCGGHPPDPRILDDTPEISSMIVVPRGSSASAELARPHPLRDKAFADSLRRFYRMSESFVSSFFEGSLTRHPSDSYDGRLGHGIVALRREFPNLEVRLEPATFESWVAGLKFYALTQKLEQAREKGSFSAMLDGVWRSAEALYLAAK